MQTDFTKKLFLIEDEKIKKIKHDFFQQPQKNISKAEFIEFASHWFLSTKLNSIKGIEQFPHVDITIGCTNFIENICLKNKWNVQVLPDEYSYYALMGKTHTNVGQFEPKIPLIVSMPNWRHGKHNNWQDILNECQEKQIDIHLDCAWLTASKDIDIDLTHPCIKSVGMSISKYIGSWNRVGLRWSKSRTIDSITLLNEREKYNETLTSCGYHVMRNLPRDYGWNTYGEKYKKIVQDNNLEATNFFYVAKRQDQLVGLSNMLIK